jgi:DNA-binding CsgD family transcriptional regulator
MESVVAPRIWNRLPSVWFLGLGFWWAAWFSEQFKGSSWLSLGQHGPVLTQAGFLIGTVPYALTFLLLIALRKRLSSLHERIPLLVGAAVVSGIGLAVVSLHGTTFIGPVGSVIGVLLTQAAGALLVLSWWELCCAVGARRTCIGVSASIFVGAGLHILMVALGSASPLAAAIVLAFFPALTLVSLVMMWRDPRVQPLDAAVQQEPFHMPANIMVGLFAYGFATGFMVNLTTLQPHPGSGVALASTAWNGGTALLILAYALFKRTFDLRFLSWPILISLAVGFMLLPVAGYSYANDVAHAGIICVALFWITTCSDIAHRVPAPALAVVGWGAFANAGGSAIGGLVCAVLLGMTTLNAWHLSVIALGVVMLQILASAPLFGGTTSASTLWGLLSQPAQPAPELPDGLVEGRCAEVATANGLTPREREILVLLAQSRTADEIGKALVISDGTVRTHIKRIHEKLGVHSQPQLIRMIVFDSHADYLAQTQGDPSQP